MFLWWNKLRPLHFSSKHSPLFLQPFASDKRHCALHNWLHLPPLLSWQMKNTRVCPGSQFCKNGIFKIKTPKNVAVFLMMQFKLCLSGLKVITNVLIITMNLIEKSFFEACMSKSYLRIIEGLENWLSTRGSLGSPNSVYSSHLLLKKSSWEQLLLNLKVTTKKMALRYQYTPKLTV